jgi:hypothetical protein
LSDLWALAGWWAASVRFDLAPGKYERQEMPEERDRPEHIAFSYLKVTFHNYIFHKALVEYLTQAGLVKFMVPGS